MLISVPYAGMSRVRFDGLAHRLSARASRAPQRSWSKPNSGIAPSQGGKAGAALCHAGAAWALATQIDNLDAHDGLNATRGHIGCNLVPALFAYAEQHPSLTGRQALAALAMGDEVAARAAIALHAMVSDYHTSGAWNAPGVAAMRHSARFPAGRWSDVTVRLKNGRVMRSGDCNARGGPETPMPESDIRAKLSVMAGRALSAARMDALWSMRQRLLDPSAEFSQLAALVTLAPDRP